MHDPAAATASRHRFAASARKIRSAERPHRSVLSIQRPAGWSRCSSTRQPANGVVLPTTIARPRGAPGGLPSWGLGDPAAAGLALLRRAHAEASRDPEELTRLH
jgi:hypothetical protein